MAYKGFELMTRHAKCWVDTGLGYKRPAEIWGYSGPDDAPSQYWVRYTDIECPKTFVTINMVEYPQGYSDYYPAARVEIVDA